MRQTAEAVAESGLRDNVQILTEGIDNSNIPFIESLYGDNGISKEIRYEITRF